MPDAAGLAEPAFRSLDPRVRLLWRLSGIVGGLIWLVVALLLERVLTALAGEGAIPFAPPGGALVLPVLGIMIVRVLLWPGLRYRTWGFALGEEDLRLRHGVLWRTASVVPLPRIQHVDTRSGPFERALGLASVIVYTAGSVGAAQTIPGLSQEAAAELRDQLALLSGTDDAV